LRWQNGARRVEIMRALWEIGCNGSLFMRARSEGHGAGAIQAAATAARQVEASIIRRSFFFFKEFPGETDDTATRPDPRSQQHLHAAPKSHSLAHSRAEHAIQHPAHPHASVAPASARGEKGLDALRPPLVALHGPRVPLVRVVVVLARLRAAHLLSLPLLLLLALLNPAQVTQPQQPLGRAHVEEAAGGPKKLQDVP
jgi:hypothetical protein